jgi:TIR domain
MLADDAIDTIAAWLWRNGDAAIVERFVPVTHPARAWIQDDLSSSDQLTQLIRVLANGGHLPLVAALILSARNGEADLPMGAAQALAHALSAWDECACRVTAARQEIVICYAHEDAARVERIVRVLRDASLQVFRDTDSILFGNSIAATVVRAIQLCRIALVIVSEASNTSHWISREIALLLQGATRIIVPVVIDDVPLPPTIRDHFAVDLRDLTLEMPVERIDGRLQRLIDTIRRGQDATGMLLQS